MYAHCGCALLWSVQPLPLLSLTLLPPTSPFFNSFQYTSLYPLPSHLMLCDITDALSFSVTFPKFHRVVLLLQPCSTSEFVYDHACFVYMFIFVSVFHV
jgi:hypothetical protein